MGQIKSRTRKEYRTAAGVRTAVDYAVAYGHVFTSFCLVVRPAFQFRSRESLGYALHRGLCRVLELDLNEVGVSFRRAIVGGEEIILYDKAPGGAGLVKAQSRASGPNVGCLRNCQTVASLP